MSEENNNKEKKNLEDELAGIKAEMAELKDMMKQKAQESSSGEGINIGDEPRDSGNFRFVFDSDEFDGIDETLNTYLEGVMSGVAGNLKRTMEQFSHGFMGQNAEHLREVGREMKRVKRELEHEAKSIKREVSRAQREAQRAAKEAVRHRNGIRFQPLTEEEEDAFYELAPNLTGALADTRRLKLLRELEKGPKYQGDLSEVTDLKGGTFKHHMDTLLELGYVYQEASRGRYLIRQLGVEALKLAEMLFRRYNAEKNVKEVEVEFEDEEGVEEDVEMEVEEDVEAEVEHDVNTINDSLNDEDL
jgi:DNA-binding transcriptional ArsR family regulator